MKKTELTDFNMFCILLHIFPTIPIFKLINSFKHTGSSNYCGYFTYLFRKILEEMHSNRIF